MPQMKISYDKKNSTAYYMYFLIIIFLISLNLSIVNNYSIRRVFFHKKSPSSDHCKYCFLFSFFSLLPCFFGTASFLLICSFSSCPFFFYKNFYIANYFSEIISIITVFFFQSYLSDVLFHLFQVIFFLLFMFYNFSKIRLFNFLGPY